MKKNQKITALSAILLLLAGGSTSCNKEAYNYVDCSQFTSMNCESFFDIVHDPTASIIGKWQLVKSYSNWNNTDPRCIDHCHEKNVLVFKKNGKMTASSTQDRTSSDSYTIVGGYLIFSRTPEHERHSTTLKISSEKLVIIDGNAPTQYFVKIK